jgi:hypothetical protein
MRLDEAQRLLQQRKEGLEEQQGKLKRPKNSPKRLRSEQFAT